MRTRVYVDGYNLYYACLRRSPYKWLNIHALTAGIETEFGRFPALQIVTLANLFLGQKPKLPPLISPVKKALRVETRASHQKGAQGSLI